MVVNSAGKVTFSNADAIAIRNDAKVMRDREIDRFGSLIDGVSNSGDGVNLAKHHIIPESKIRSEFKKFADDTDITQLQFKAKLEKYINHEDNRECRKIFSRDVPVQNRNYTNEVSQYFLTVVSWNPNNLRAGPLGDERGDDPGNVVDTAVATKAEQRIAANGDKNILDKLTDLRTSTNPTWEKTRREPKPWTVKTPTGAPYSVTQLLKRNNDDEREFNIVLGGMSESITVAK